jgi:hypothetical protein
MAGINVFISSTWDMLREGFLRASVGILPRRLSGVRSPWCVFRHQHQYRGLIIHMYHSSGVALLGPVIDDLIAERTLVNMHAQDRMLCMNSHSCEIPLSPAATLHVHCEAHWQKARNQY